MPVDPVSTGISAALDIGETVAGFVNEGKVKKEADLLATTRPKYQVQPEFAEDVSLASSELSNGMSADAKRAYDNATAGAQSNSVSALLKGGGDVNDIGAIYGSGESGRENLSTMRDAIRQNNITNLISARTAMAQEKDTQWQVNELDPWKDKAEANATARENADKEIWGGLGSLASTGMRATADKNLNTPTVTNPTTTNTTPTPTQTPAMDQYFPFSSNTSLTNWPAQKI